MVGFGSRWALGWTMLAMTFIPAGDMTIVLSNDGSAATALGVHGPTACLVALTAGLLLRERPAQATTPAPTPTTPRVNVPAHTLTPRARLPRCNAGRSGYVCNRTRCAIPAGTRSWSMRTR
ncbi:DUF4267 domain-containing protein [Embleya sp. NPDC050154]|uniref:DUF4267 domain-containing protein n=1 Tax=Embleya sp. NPDC050154 TaxID=3363988 RepID=UPI0037A93329